MLHGQVPAQESRFTAVRAASKLPHAWRRCGVASRRHPLEKSVSGN
jgi:hypothetical protein